MSGTDGDVRIALCRNLQRVNDLAFANEQFSMVAYSTFGEPCGIKPDDCQTGIVESYYRHVA